MKTRKFFGMCAFFLVVGGLATLFALLRENLVLAPYRFMEAQGRLGAVYVTIFMAAWIICGFPSTIVEVLAGFMYGFGWGFLIGLIGKQIASTISFTLARRFALRCTERLQKRFFMLRAMDTALKDSPRRILFLVCVAYIPASVKNYGLALFKCVSFTMFFLVIGVTGIPYTLMSTWIGATSFSIIEVVHQQTETEATDTEDGKGTQTVSALRMAMMIVGGVSAVILLVVLGVYGRRARRELIERADIEDAAALEAAEEEIAAVAKVEESAELESIRICGSRDDTYVQLQDKAQSSRKLRRTQSDSKLSVHSRASLNLHKFAQHHALGVKLEPLAPLTAKQRVSPLRSVPSDGTSFGPRLVSPKYSAGTHPTQPKETQKFTFPEPKLPRKMTFFEMLEQDPSDSDSIDRDENVMSITPGKVKNLTQVFEAKSASPQAAKSPLSAAGIGLNFSLGSPTEVKPHTSGRTPKCVLGKHASRPRDRIRWSPPKRFQEDPKLKRQPTLPPLAVSTSLPSDRIFLPPRAPLPQSKNSPLILLDRSGTHSQRSRSGKSTPRSASLVSGVTHKYGSSHARFRAKHSIAQAHLERQRQYRYLAKMFVGSARASGTASRDATARHRRASVM